VHLCINLLCDSCEIINNVTYGDKLVDVIVTDLDVESFLAHKHEISKLEGIDAEIVYKLSGGGDVSGINGKLVNEKILNLFKHKKKTSEKVVGLQNYLTYYILYAA